MLQKLVGFSPTTPSMKHSPNAISHPEWPLQLTFIQLPFSLENPKPNIQCRTNTYTDTVIPSFLSAVCLWMHFPLMSASCRRTASKLYYTPSHWCRRLSVLFFSRFVCSAVWHHCFRVVHLDPSPWCDTAPPPSWHLPEKRSVRSSSLT